MYAMLGLKGFRLALQLELIFVTLDKEDPSFPLHRSPASPSIFKALPSQAAQIPRW